MTWLDEDPLVRRMIKIVNASCRRTGLMGARFAATGGRDISGQLRTFFSNDSQEHADQKRDSYAKRRAVGVSP